MKKDRADHVAGLLILLGDRLARAADRYLALWSMVESDYNVLRILNGATKPLTQVEIGRRLLCSRANVTKIVDRLERKRLARRRTSADRRENLIEITAQGVKFLRETIHNMIEISRESLVSLTTEQLIDLEKLLLKVIQDNPVFGSSLGKTPFQQPS